MLNPGEYWNEVLENLPVSPESKCSYFSDKQSRMRFFFSHEQMPPDLLETALAKGFRRCGDTYYSTSCNNCNLCISYRVSTAEFKPSRSQKRCFKKNEDLHYKVVEPHKTKEKEDIYLKYQYHQHFLRPADASTSKGSFNEKEQLETMTFQMYTNPLNSRELEIYLGDKLLGFGIIDIALESISLVYFVFHPDYANRSLGKLNILYSIEWALKEELKYVYLGYFIPGHMKMDYKSHFKPAEMLDSISGNWSYQLPELTGKKES